ncbi:MAG: acetyl-CoA carboxylase biotin carboxyl carrier protein [Clostridium sp.]|uniref:acetyl-CoA carboxylase biotin carboxyl carrier protein n=1 Tax=Clostridium sp. TaxID=1506 RepID=UPI00307080A1
MNYDAIERLIKLVNDSNLKELELEEAGLKIRMSKNDNSKVVYSEENKIISRHTTMESNEFDTIDPTSQIAQVNLKSQVSIDEVASVDKRFILKSPMVGTFYSSPTEDGKPYVKVGDSVSQGSTLCIVEAMKLMNEIECEVDGIIAEVFVENGEVIEFGQPIMAIRN